MNPTERTLNALKEIGHEPKPISDGWICRCPSHDDTNPSLKVGTGDDGRALLHCFAGCEVDDILNEIGLTKHDLFDSGGSYSLPEANPQSPVLDSGPKTNARRNPIATSETSIVTYPSAREAIATLESRNGKCSNRWVYIDEYDEPVGVVCRWDKPGEKKRILPVSKQQDGSWAIKGMQGDRPLLNLDDALQVDEVVVVEGEGVADTARELGFAAVTSAGGSGAASKTDWTPLKGKRVVVMPDAGRAGESYAKDVIECLRTVDPDIEIKVVRLPGLQDGEDLVDYIAGQPESDHETIAKNLRDVVIKTTSECLYSIPASNTRSAGIESNFKIVPLDEIGEYEPPPWIWPGFIARGYISLLTSYPKVGKTTMLAHLLHDLSAGGHLVEKPMTDPVLIVSEESHGHWSRRRDDIGLTRDVHLMSRPFKGKPKMDSWCELVDVIAEAIAETKYGLIVIDTVPNHWPVVDENDAGQVSAALSPLHKLTEAGAAVLLTHHARKSGGQEGQAARGSGALTGFVDIMIELRRLSADDTENTRRVLSTFGRFDECPGELVIDLHNDGYRVVGSRAQANLDELEEKIDEVLTNAGKPLNADEIREEWPTETKIGVRNLRRVLNCPTNKGRWKRSGTGNRGDAHRYVMAG
jgi:hypothetical protein